MTVYMNLWLLCEQNLAKQANPSRQPIIVSEYIYDHMKAAEVVFEVYKGYC